MSTADSTDLTVTVTLDMISGYFLGIGYFLIGRCLKFSKSPGNDESQVPLHASTCSCQSKPEQIAEQQLGCDTRCHDVM